MIDAKRLTDLLGRPETRRLVDALKRRLERGIRGGTLTIPKPDDAERRAVEQILGRAPGRGRDLSVPADALEEVLRRSGIAPDLATAITALRGPLRDLAAERAAIAARWDTLFDALAEGPQEQLRWIQDLAGTGLLKRLAGSDPDRAGLLVEAARAVLARMPASGLSLSRLAAEALGNAHGLDSGEPVGTLVRRALILRQGMDEGGAEDDRALWAGAGVLIGGGITSLVLTLNLPASGTSPTALALKALSSAGEPCHLTLRQLVRDAPQWNCRGLSIRVCENPAVVAEAAARLGAGCAPLVCTQGQPGAAVTTLVRQLTAAGAQIAYHGDFDWAGIRIANGVITRHRASPWRMSRDDYLAAPATGKPLQGDPALAVWDAGVGPAMQGRGEAVEEECVIECLLTDLAGG